MIKIRYIFAILIAYFFLAGCQPPRAFVVIEVMLGEKIEVKGAHLSKALEAKYVLSEIVEDSRCVAGDVCAQEERFIVRVRRKKSFLKSAEYIDLVYSDKIIGKYVSKDGYCAALVGVDPLKIERPVDNYDNYRFKIFIGEKDYICRNHLVWEDEKTGVLTDGDWARRTKFGSVQIRDVVPTHCTEQSCSAHSDTLISAWVYHNRKNPEQGQMVSFTYSPNKPSPVTHFMGYKIQITDILPNQDESSLGDYRYKVAYKILDEPKSPSP